MEGPRPVKAEERASLRKLLNRTFRGGGPGDMFAEYPLLFNEGNANHLIVIVENGEVVSHAGMVVRRLLFEGVPLTAGLVGSVATAEESRGRGYATKCLDFLFDEAARESVDLAWISGSRGLYLLRGAAKAGCEQAFEIAPGEGEGDLTVRELNLSDVEAAAALYSKELVRFCRSRDDWSGAWRSHFAMMGRARFWGVFRGEELRAYLMVHEPRDEGAVVLLAEFAGDRFDAAAAAPGVAKRMGLGAIRAHVSAADSSGLKAFERVAQGKKLVCAAGTFLPLRMAQCMEGLRPRIARCCGEEVASEVRFYESGPGLGSVDGRDACLQIVIGDQGVVIRGRAQVVRFLFGLPDSARPDYRGAPSVIEKLRPAFPLPTPWYGINYV